MKLTKTFAITVILALFLSLSGAIVEELFAHCDDCCGESTCEMCISCLCCNALGGALVEDASTGDLVAVNQALEIHDWTRSDRLSYELIDPPPRS